MGGPEKTLFTKALNRFRTGEKDTAWGGLVSSREEYEKLYYPIRHGLFRLDATPNYLHAENAAALIQRECGSQARIVVVFRDPLERALSHYRLFCKLGLEKEPFESAIALGKKRTEEMNWAPTWDYLKYSGIEKPYKHFKEIFGDRMLAISFDVLRRKPRKTLKEVFNWLGLTTPVFLWFRKSNTTNASGFISGFDAEKAVRLHGGIDLDAEREFLSKLFFNNNRGVIL